jgi:voltage-gated potassium channel
VTRQPFLRTRAGRVALLAMLLGDVFVIPVLLTLDIMPVRIGDLFFAVTMLVAMTAMGTGKGRRLVLTVALAAFVIQFFRFVDKGNILVIIDATLSALAMGTFAAMVLVDVFRQDPVADRLIDVILAYLLVGAMYAFVYEAVNVALPGSITLDGGKVTAAGYAYFSFTTMTSVGFGDALPMNPVSRAIAMGQALTGQLYVAVLIARFANPQRRAAQRLDGDAR